MQGEVWQEKYGIGKIVLHIVNGTVPDTETVRQWVKTNHKELAELTNKKLTNTDKSVALIEDWNVLDTTTENKISFWPECYLYMKPHEAINLNNSIIFVWNNGMCEAFNEVMKEKPFTDSNVKWLANSF